MTNLNLPRKFSHVTKLDNKPITIEFMVHRADSEELRIEANDMNHALLISHYYSRDGQGDRIDIATGADGKLYVWVIKKQQKAAA
jgi:hypothetical protein